jgi:1-acyl-sn-glycerol-3-phosphate acyltransferase
MAGRREPFHNFVLYHLFKWSVVNPVFRIYFRGRVRGWQHVPRQGPLVIVSNHASDLDPPFISCSVRRPVAFMAKEELFKIPVLKQWARLYGAFPVKRGSADRQAIESALAFLRKDWAVGIFLEGHRTRDARIHAPKIGAALIAVKARAPFLPVSLWGSQRIFRPGSLLARPVPVTVRIGRPIACPETPDREALQDIVRHCADVIHAMHDEGR